MEWEEYATLVGPTMSQARGDMVNKRQQTILCSNETTLLRWMCILSNKHEMRRKISVEYGYEESGRMTHRPTRQNMTTTPDDWRGPERRTHRVVLLGNLMLSKHLGNLVPPDTRWRGYLID